MNERPTPETDAEMKRQESMCGKSAISADFARRLERELAEAREQTEKMRESFERCRQVAATTSECWRQDHEKMREAIREAHRLLVAVDAGAQPDVEGLNWYDHRSQTLPKLQPFLDQ